MHEAPGADYRFEKCSPVPWPLSEPVNRAWDSGRPPWPRTDPRRPCALPCAGIHCPAWVFAKRTARTDVFEKVTRGAGGSKTCQGAGLLTTFVIFSKNAEGSVHHPRIPCQARHSGERQSVRGPCAPCPCRDSCRGRRRICCKP